MAKSVFITGGSRGIGAACVRVFAEAGYSVAFTYNKGEEAAKNIRDEVAGAYGGPETVLPLKLDLSSDKLSEDLEGCVREAKRYFGIRSFDALVLNAGVSTWGLITEMKDEAIRELVNVNLTAQIMTVRAFTGDMIMAKGGSIVIISSIWGVSGASCESVYSATKAGLIGFGKSLAAELGPSGIRTNILAPGVIDTDMNSTYTEEEMEVLAELSPLGRIGQPEEVAQGALFLASDKSTFITGQVLKVDGGIIV